MPAPKNNENAVKHGQRCRFGLMIGGGPKATRYITTKLCEFRDALEQATVATHGEISIPHAAAIVTALRWERAAALSTKWFREKGDGMAVLDRVALQKAIADASERRDRAIEKLKLDAKPADVWADLHQPNASHVAHEARTRDLATETAPDTAEPASRHEAAE